MTEQDDHYAAIPVAEPARWRWSPHLGRWRRDYGLPDAPALVELSTDMAPGSDRYDFWREIVYYEFDADPLAAERSGGFDAWGMAGVTGGAQLHHWRSDAMSGRRTRAQADADGGDSVSIGIVLAGERLAEDADGRQWRAGAGQAFVYDAAQASRLSWSDHEGLHLTLRRPAILAALGSEVPPAADLTERLNRSPLFTLVREQLVAAAKALPSLAAPERAFALDQATRLVSFLLTRAGEGSAEGDGPARGHLHAAAMRLIERDLASPDLTPDWLAAQLGCSRTTLYRAFAERDDTIAAAIQRTRFDRARLELLATGPEQSVAEIAARCGLYDSTNFSSRFRRRFGYAPGELRRR